MQIFHKPMTARECAELRALISPPTTVLRIGLSSVATVFLGWICRKDTVVCLLRLKLASACLLVAWMVRPAPIVAQDRELSPAWSSSGSVAFVGASEGDFDIYVIDEVGAVPHNVTASPGLDVGPTWSPDGTRIAFVSTRGERRRLWVMEASGDNPTPVELGVDVVLSRPAWDPTGNRIAFVVGPHERADLFVVDLETGALSRLTDDEVLNGSPSWSPDGRRLAFSSNRDAGNVDVYRIDADGTGITRLTSHDAEDGQPSSSPDGSRIAFFSTRAGNADIYVMDADARTARQVTRNPARDASPSWSPDGRELVFSSNRSGSDQLYVVPVEGGEVRRLGTPSMEPVGYGSGELSADLRTTRKAHRAGDPVTFSSCFATQIGSTPAPRGPAPGSLPPVRHASDPDFPRAAR